METTRDRLQVVQFIGSEPEKVFQAWTDQDLVRKWLCPEECRVTHNEAEVHIGGHYRESMTCGGSDYTVHGTYREIIPNRKLVFSHEWEAQDAVETLVTVTFEGREGGTEVQLTQNGFRDSAAAESHAEGWSSALRNLARELS